MAEALACYYACGPKPGQCFDEWAAIGLVDDGEEQRAEIEAADTLDRLMCDCCQGYVDRHEELTRSGPEMLCDDCCPVLEKTG